MSNPETKDKDLELITELFPKLNISEKQVREILENMISY